MPPKPFEGRHKATNRLLRSRPQDSFSHLRHPRRLVLFPRHHSPPFLYLLQLVGNANVYNVLRAWASVLVGISCCSTWPSHKLRNPTNRHHVLQFRGNHRILRSSEILSPLSSHPDSGTRCAWQRSAQGSVASPIYVISWKKASLEPLVTIFHPVIIFQGENDLCIRPLPSTPTE